MPKTATRSTGPLAGRRPRSTTHQGRGAYGRKASDAEVTAMTEAMVTFKEVLTGDRTLLTRRKS